MIWYAILITIAFIVLVEVSHKRNDKRTEHKNRSEGAKKGWRKRKAGKVKWVGTVATQKWVGKENNGTK